MTERGIRPNYRQLGLALRERPIPCLEAEAAWDLQACSVVRMQAGVVGAPLGCEAHYRL